MATAAHRIEGARLRTPPLAVAPLLPAQLPPTRSTSSPLYAFWRSSSRSSPAGRRELCQRLPDGIKGTDEDRVGPLRLVGSGVASPVCQVRRLRLLRFSDVAGLALVGSGEPVVVPGDWRLQRLRGGGHTRQAPYGYMGLGDVFVRPLRSGRTSAPLHTQAHTLTLLGWSALSASA